MMLWAMALQDLTPQLRTRITGVERLVGMFVFLAAVLMAVAFGYYLYQTGKSRGWTVNKVPYYCYTRDATGLRVGDPVRMLGREVGRIVQVETAPPDDWFLQQNFNVFVKFEIWEPYFGYILTDSKVRVLASDFLGSRYLEVTRGDPNTGLITVGEQKRWEDRTIRSDKNPDEMVPLRGSKDGYWLRTEELPAIAQRAEEMVRTLAAALPVITMQVTQTLAQAGLAASNANAALLQLQPALAQLQPTLAHLEVVTRRLSEEEGAVGRLLLTTNLQERVDTALASMDATLTNTTELIRTSERQLQDLTRRIALTLDNVTLVTSNLSGQVQANSYVLGEVSSLVVGADDMLQGLKRHWLLRSAFVPTTNAPSTSLLAPSMEWRPLPR